MSPTLNFGIVVSGGVSGGISRQQPRTADAGSGGSPLVPHGYAGTVTARTDNNTATITLANGHAITTGMLVDVYFPAGVQYKVTVGTVSGNSCPIDLGIGDNLPVLTTAVVVSPRVIVNAAIDGDALAFLAMQLLFANMNDTSKGHVDFRDASAAEVCEIDLLANGVQEFDIAGGATNRFTGNPITVFSVSNGSSTSDAFFRYDFVVDSTP